MVLKLELFSIWRKLTIYPESVQQILFWMHFSREFIESQLIERSFSLGLLGNHVLGKVYSLARTLFCLFHVCYDVRLAGGGHNGLVLRITFWHAFHRSHIYFILRLQGWSFRMQFQPFSHQFNTIKIVLAHSFRIILEKYVFNQASHGLLVVVWSVLDACPDEPLLGPGP